MSTIDIQRMRYINLLDNTSHVKTRKCFVYNNTIFYAVPKELISKAIGPSAINIKKIQDKINKKIKIIQEPIGIEDAKRFIEDIVSPLQFKSLEIKEDIFLLTAGNQSKAALIGRNRRRYNELKQVIEDFFNKDFKIL